MKDCAVIVVDILYDFIDGSLACQNAENAAVFAKDYIENTPAPVIFICDHHPADHCSFVDNGGIWPPHCVSGTHGAEVHSTLVPFISEELTFYKGYHKDEEEYSGFQGKNLAGQTLQEVLETLEIKNVIITGIATEYCVRNTAEDLLKAGFNVTVLKDGLGYVDKAGHEETLKTLEEEGIAIR